MKLKKVNLINGCIYLCAAILNIFCALLYAFPSNLLLIIGSGCYIICSILNFILYLKDWNKNREYKGYYPEKKIKIKNVKI